MSNQENLFREGTKLHTVWLKGQEWFEKASNQDVMTLLGIDNAGYASNIRRDVAEKTGWTIFGATGERVPRSSNTAKAGKIRGCLPIKVAVRISRQLDLDEEIEPSWEHWKQCYEQNESFEGFTMSRFAGGEDSEGGKSYRLWIDSNRANDAAIAAAAARAADPTIQLKEKLSAAQKRIVELEAELETAKRVSAPRGVQRGGELTEDMLKIMKQRFHPDRNNGSPELCNAVMQWLNAIVL